MIHETGCAGIMIGRQALTDPWIFRDTHAYLTTGILPTPPTRLERTMKMIEHFKLMIERDGPERAVIGFRKRIGFYAKAIGPCPKLRREIPTVKTVAEWEERVFAFVEDLKSGRDTRRTDPKRKTDRSPGRGIGINGLPFSHLHEKR